MYIPNVDLLDELTKPNEKNFRLRGKRYMLTYKWHHDKTWIKNFINATHPVRYCFVAHETGHDDKTPYNHSHVLIEFREAISRQGKDASRTFDLGPGYMNMTVGQREDGRAICVWETMDPPITAEDWALGCVHPNIAIVNTEKHWKNALKYMGKEDTDCDLEIREKFPNLEDTVSVFEKLEGIKTNADLLKTLTSFNEVNGALAAFDAVRTIRNIVPPELEYSWQHDLIDAIERRDTHLFNKRSVVWIYDAVGSCGKSDLASYLAIKMPNRFLTLDRAGSDSDFAENCRTALMSGWTGEGLFIDLPRAAAVRQFYTSLENYKNNRVTCTKYRGGCFFLSDEGCSKKKGNMLIVMANFWPQIHGKMSVDRWRLFELHKVKQTNEAGIECEDIRMQPVFTHDIGKLQLASGICLPGGIEEPDGPAFGFVIPTVGEMYMPQNGACTFR